MKLMTQYGLPKHPEIPNNLRLSVGPTCVRWEPHSVLTEGLILQTDVGDVQTPVCILIAMGDRRNELAIDELIYVRSDHI